MDPNKSKAAGSGLQTLQPPKDIHPQCRPVLYPNPEAGKQAEEKTLQTDQEV